jgi:outer membrane protein assembly factor BamE (lipoprotein component of BamABCDE complex)
VLAAGFAAGCSSSSKRSPAWSSSRDKGSTPVAGMQQTITERDWEDLRVGMTESQVRRELGRPERVTEYRSGAENWFYSDGGVVYFNSRDRVADWRYPRYAYRSYMADGPVYERRYYARDTYRYYD